LPLLRVLRRMERKLVAVSQVPLQAASWDTLPGTTPSSALLRDVQSIIIATQ